MSLSVGLLTLVDSFTNASISFKFSFMSLTLWFMSCIPCSRSTNLDPCVTLEVTEEDDLRMLGEPRVGVLYTEALGVDSCEVDACVVGVLA